MSNTTPGPANLFGGVNLIKPEIIHPIIPPLKSLVAEYLFELYSTMGIEEYAKIHAELADFLAWETKRRTPPAITTRPWEPNVVPGVAMWTP